MRIISVPYTDFLLCRAENNGLLSTSYCEFYSARSYAHARKPSSWHPFTRLQVPLLYQQSLT